MAKKKQKHSKIKAMALTALLKVKALALSLKRSEERRVGKEC